MKNLLKKYSFLLLLCLLVKPASGFVDVPVKKQVIKTYADLKNERLVINNQYGDVTVKTWHQQKILIRVTLSAYAKTTAAANQLLQRVNISADRDVNQIHVASVIKEQKKALPVGVILQKKPLLADTSAKGKSIKIMPKEGCNISYEIFLPAGVSLNVSNQFGDITMGDYLGVVDLDVKFGNIKAGTLSGLSKLKIEQGDIDLKNISSGDLKAKGFGSIKINGIGGKFTGRFSSGNLLNIGLTRQADSIIVDADNIRQMNISGTAATNAGYNIKTILSKLFNKSTLPLRELGKDERKPQSKLGVDSLQKLLKEKMNEPAGTETEVDAKKKKFEILLVSQLKKLREYEGTTGNGKGKIGVKVAFSILSILN